MDQLGIEPRASVAELPMFSKRLAVIRGEDEICVVKPAQVPERLDDVSHPSIDACHFTEIKLMEQVSLRGTHLSSHISDFESCELPIEIDGVWQVAVPGPYIRLLFRRRVIRRVRIDEPDQEKEGSVRG